MLKGKQRSYLKSLANRLSPVLQIGKYGVTDTVIAEIDNLLEARELIKINILNNSALNPKEVAADICERLRAEFVQSLGNKIVIYRKSEDNKRIELPR